MVLRIQCLSGPGRGQVFPTPEGLGWVTPHNTRTKPQHPGCQTANPVLPKVIDLGCKALAPCWPVIPTSSALHSPDGSSPKAQKFQVSGAIRHRHNSAKIKDCLFVDKPDI